MGVEWVGDFEGVAEGLEDKGGFEGRVEIGFDVGEVEGLMVGSEKKGPFDGWVGMGAPVGLEVNGGFEG